MMLKLLLSFGFLLLNTIAVQAIPIADSLQFSKRQSRLIEERRLDPLEIGRDRNADYRLRISNQFIIQLRQGASISEHRKLFLNEYLKRHAPAKLLHFYEIGSFKGYSIQLPSAADQNSNDQLEDALDDLRYSASIEVIEQDYLCQGSAIQSNAPWNLDRITKRSRNQMDSKYYYPDKAGAGVNVYILDTGVRITHEQFQGRARFGASFITRPSAGDPHGHGTAVAGVVASAVYGVAKAANIISVQVSNASNYATWSDVIAGLDWTLKDFYNRRKQPSVVNLSINGARSAALELAIDNMARRGIHMVVSAGNDNKDACLNSPSNSRHASVVGASSFDDYKSSTSNFGRCIDIYAPGEFIMTLGKSDDRQIEGSFGTSVAAPHVAGVKALLLSVNSTVTPIDLNNLIYARANRGMIFGLPTNTVNRLLYTSA